MTTEDIANLALSRIGEEGIDSLSDSDKKSAACALWLPIVRDEVMRMFPWSSLVKRETLKGSTVLWITGTVYGIGDIVAGDTYLVSTVLTARRFYECVTPGTSASVPRGEGQDIPDGTARWRYIGPVNNLTTYAYQYAIPADCMRIIDFSEELDYQREGRFIFTSSNPAILVYIARDTNPTNWTAILQEAIISGLASKLAYTLTGSKEIMQQCAQEYGAYLSMERFASGNDSSEPNRGSEQWA